MDRSNLSAAHSPSAKGDPAPSDIRPEETAALPSSSSDPLLPGADAPTRLPTASQGPQRAPGGTGLALEPLAATKRPRLAAEGQGRGPGGPDADPNAEGQGVSPQYPDWDNEGNSQPHDIVLRIEWAKSTEVKVLTLLLVTCVLAGIAVTTYMKVRAASAGTSWYLLGSTAPSFQDNLISGCICVGMSGIMWASYVGRGLLLRLRRLRWDPRRLRMCLTRLAELTAITVSVACWTYAGDARRLEEDCNSFNWTLVWTYAVRLSMSNTMLCLWTMTARGMTVWRGKPLSKWQRAKLMARRRHLTTCCSGGERTGNLGNGSGDNCPDTGEKATESGAAASVRVEAGRPTAANAETAIGRKGGGGSGDDADGPDASGPCHDGRRSGSGAECEHATPPPPRPTPAPSLAALPMTDAPFPPTSPTSTVALPASTPFANTGADAAAAPSPGWIAAADAPVATETSGSPTIPKAVQTPASIANSLTAPVQQPSVSTGTAAAEVSISINSVAGMSIPFPGLPHTDQDEQLYIDAAWWQYASPFLFLWLPFEGLVVAHAVLMRGSVGWDQRQDECLASFLACRTTSRASSSLLHVLLAAEVLYVLIYFSYCFNAFMFLRSRSYVLYRQLNIYLSVEARIRGFVLLFIVANDIVQALHVPRVDVPGAGPQRCRYSIDIVLGNWSTQVVTVVLVCALAWLFMPRSIHGNLPLMQATLQRFAWTEPDLPAQLARRLAGAPLHDRGRLEQLLREPMFCFETALKLTYWCEHIYYYEEDGCIMRLSIEKLLELYGLQQLQVLREPESDAKAMIAWSPEQCLICFRGTASLKAACVDLQAMLVPYYNRAAWAHTFRLAPLAAVHSGFQWSWLHGGFNGRVLDWVRQYRQLHPTGRIMVTGHSLGGAHAMLCTLDIVHALGASLPRDHITCYTFGAPRVGNHTFATLYDKAVNETWHVINGNDMVPLTPKCVGWFVYKHPGHKVIVKRRGDIIVRPTFTENSVLRLPCSRSLRHHLLGSYLRSMMAVMRHQTRGKYMEGAVSGLMHLARFKLPEVDAVLGELVREVHSVASAAGKALGSMGGGDAGPTHGSERNAANVAAAAASAASRGGSIVYRSLVRHGSLRLLLGQSKGEPRPEGAPQQHASDLRPLQLLSQLAFRVNMGMELLGVETGVDDEEEPRLASGGAGGRSGGQAAPGGDSLGRIQLAAYERAAAGKTTARQQYKQSRKKRRKEPRPTACGDPAGSGPHGEPGLANDSEPDVGGKGVRANSRKRLHAVRRGHSRSNGGNDAVARAQGASGPVAQAGEEVTVAAAKS